MRTQQLNRAYQAALYLRLSKDDEGAGESSSISTQRSILQEYAKTHGLSVAGEYVDDGYSGTNYDRPAFQRMIADIEAGKINCVLTKDDCVIIELNAESPIKCGFCAVSSIF